MHTGSAPNPLAYCFWNGLARSAMTFAQEAARRGVELRALHARVETDVDQSRALGVSDRSPPVERIERRGARPSVWGLSGAIRWRTTDGAPSCGRED